ncbi:MAG: methionyl-tRNA formyltransferase [Verrucomicrobia bacterium]|nr:methionyl-tRNA formyltransferase [Verrucomicrobiota bacterium]MCF7707577.1 methionyl-tRNA formyltransferase [Verrucomicrobiota bacterium]
MGQLRIVFMGTADLACPSLESLASKNEFSIEGVITQPDKPRGRRMRMQPPPVKVTAERLGLEVFQPEKMRHPDAIALLERLNPDLIVVAAYGQIVPASVLSLPPYGCINVHASILPRHRGAAPIQWAILNGDQQTGVTIMKMDEGLDTGDILAVRKTPIHDSDDAQTLHDRLARLGAGLLVETIPGYVDGGIIPKPQSESDASYARKIVKDDGRIDWEEPASKVKNQVRALTPWPGAFAFMPEDARRVYVKFWEVEEIDLAGSPAGTVVRAWHDDFIVTCGAGALRILSIQREGKRRMSAREFLSGTGIREGMRFE